MVGGSMGMNEDYDEFNRDDNPKGRRKYQKDTIPEPEKGADLPEEKREKKKGRGGGPGFELEYEHRKRFIDEQIYSLPLVRKVDWDIVEGLVEDIAQKFRGEDAHALNILYFAAKQGVLDKYINRLNAFYDENISHADTSKGVEEYRSLVKKLFKECYADLGISANLYPAGQVI